MNRTIRIALLLGAALSVSAAALVAVAVPREAAGQESLTVQRFRQRLNTFDTLFLTAQVPMDVQTLHGGEWRYVVRWDALRGVGTLENGLGRARWTWWDGTASRPEDSWNPGNTYYGPVVDAAIAELWAEVRAGLPNTTFAWVERAAMPEGWRWDPGAWQVQLPFAWAASWELYLALDDAGTPTGIGLWRVAEGTWAIRPSALDPEWEVPLRDDFDRREGYPSINSIGGMRWHEEGAVWSMMSLDLAASPTAEPSPFRNDGVPTTMTMAAWHDPCVAGQVTTVPVHLEFTWDATTAASSVRALDAMNAGCSIGVMANGEMLFSLTGGSQATFQGTLTLTDGAGTVLNQQPIASTLTAPSGEPVRSRSPHQKVLPLPQGVEIPALRLIADGTLTHECLDDGPDRNRVAVLFGSPLPKLAWPGCWPDMGVVQ